MVFCCSLVSGCRLNQKAHFQLGSRETFLAELPRTDSSSKFHVSIALSCDEKSWAKDLATLGGRLFLSSPWIASQVNPERLEQPRFFKLYDESNRLQGLFAGILQRSRYTRTATFHADTLPIVRGHDDTLIQIFCTLIENELRRLGVMTFEIGSYAAKPPFDFLIQSRFKTTERIEFTLPLTDRSESELLRSFGEARRRNIRAAERNRITVREVSTAAGLATLRRLQLESGERVLQRGGGDIRFSSDKSHDPYRMLVEAKICRVFIAYQDLNPLSATLCGIDNNRAYLILAGHAHEGLKLQSGTYLYWQVMRTFLGEGFTEVSLGGCKRSAQEKTDPEYGVYHYKRLWNGQENICVSGVKTLRPLASATLKLIRYFRR